MLPGYLLVSLARSDIMSLDTVGKGKVMGSVQALQSLGASVGPVMAGILFTYPHPVLRS